MPAPNYWKPFPGIRPAGSKDEPNYYGRVTMEGYHRIVLTEPLGQTIRIADPETGQVHGFRVTERIKAESRKFLAGRGSAIAPCVPLVDSNITSKIGLRKKLRR